jgi:hypothetical protein
MRYDRLFPLAGFAFIAACSNTDAARTPTGPASVARPSPTIETTISDANAPQGTHLQTGSIGCTVNSDLSVSCSTFELAGVGHIDAAVSLVAHYTATILCSNKGTNPNNSVEAQTTGFTASDDFTARSAKNGRLSVRSALADPNTDASDACPNPNWTAEVSNLTLVDFTYSVTFAGFTQPYILITGP